MAKSAAVRKDNGRGAWINPKPACFEVAGRGAFKITKLGLAHVTQLAAIGARNAEIAQYLGVSASWLRDRLDADGDSFDPEIRRAFDEGQSSFKQRLLEAQANLAETNATMAIHLGKHHLGQKEDAHEINHNIRVVGTLPDYSMAAEDWQRKFAPTPMQPAERPRVIDADDAEVVEAEK